MDKTEIIDKLKRNKEFLEKEFSVSRIGLFGSYATGSETPKSDIDILYELKTGKHEGIADIYKFEVFLKQLLQGKELDLVNAKFVNPIIEHEDRRAENRTAASSRFVHIESGRNILDRKSLAPRHIGVGFMQIDRQAIGPRKLVQHILDGGDFRQPGTIVEGSIQIGCISAVTHTSGEAIRIEAGQNQK